MVEFGDGYISESITIGVDGTMVYVNRISYADNTSILTIEENGVISTYSFEIDYQSLYLNLMNEADDVPVTYDRVAGYTYTYFKYDSYTDYLHVSGEKGYAAILSLILNALNPRSVSLKVATFVASAAVDYNFNADRETKIVTNQWWYEVTETSSGEFISYHCEYNVSTYVQDVNGNWVYLGVESDDFDSLNYY